MRGSITLKPGALSEARKRAEMSQAKLAAATGLSHGIIGFYEIGARQPSPDALTKLAEALGVDSGELCEAAA